VVVAVMAVVAVTVVVVTLRLPKVRTKRRHHHGESIPRKP
jgi:hypothetical protein